MAYDAHFNGAYSTVLTAPSPANSGTSLVVQSADGTRFPAVPFNDTVWPAGAQPLFANGANAEIVRVTAKSTDTFTITRAQESTSARSIVVGDQIIAGITVRTLTDVEGYTNPTGTINSYAMRTAPTGWLNCNGSAVSRTTYADLFAVLATSLSTFTVTIATPAVVTLTAHGLSTGDQVYLTTTGALPTGLTANTLYYIIRVDANSFNLATSRANAYVPTRIATSGSQSGVHTARDCPYGLGDGSTTFTLPDLRGRVLAGLDTTAGTAAGRLTLAQSQGVYGNIGATGGEQGHTMTTAELVGHTHSVPARDSDDAGTNAAVRGTDAGVSFPTVSTGSTTPFNIMSPVQLVNYIIKT